MKKQRVLELLFNSKPDLQARFGVKRLALFGSTARDRAESDSDIAISTSWSPSTALPPPG